MGYKPLPFSTCLVDLLIVASWAAFGLLLLWEITEYAA